MTEQQLFKAAQLMQFMGSFSSAIGEAYFHADSYNRETIVQAFKGLFERAHELTNSSATEEAFALAEAGRAISEGCERYEESQKTSRFI